jgi:glycosidase
VRRDLDEHPERKPEVTHVSTCSSSRRSLGAKISRGLVAALVPLVSLVSLSAATGCAESPALPEERSCSVTVWHKPQSRAARVEVVGDFNGWKRPGVEPDRVDDWRALPLDLSPGEQRYRIYEDGVALTDRNVPTTAFLDDGSEVTLVDVPDCTKPGLRVDRVTVSPDGKGSIDATFLAARGGAEGAKLDPTSAVATTKDGRSVKGDADPATGHVHFTLDGLPRGKALFTLAARAADGTAADEAKASAWVEARPYDVRDTVLYQVVLDRFRGKDGPLAPPATPSDRAGGSIEGATAALREGFFEGIGANAIWLSPVYRNPEGKYSGSDGRMYSSYHGYWPTDPYAVDARLGGEAALETFIREAHAKGIRVLFDVVPNHVHEMHPYAKETSYTDGSSSCVCGVGDCDWATHIDSCWFAPYLPDLDWKNPTLSRKASADTVWWLDRFEADGFRIDAVPMTPRAATRRIANLARRRFAHPGNPLLVLGENFTGPGAYNLLRRDLGPFGLDGTFHFPLMWSLRESIAEERSGLSAIDVSMQESEKAWGAAGAVMGVMLGNHDVSRFASVSAGTTGGDTWEPARQITTESVLQKQRLGFGAVFSLPGIPVVYYGDELALAGKSDPDCRRVMPAESELVDGQRELRAFVSKLSKARGCSAPLRRGTYTSLYSDAERLVFSRELPEAKRAIVILTRKPLGPLDLAVAKIPPGTYRDLLTNESVTFDTKGTVDLGPYTVRLLANTPDDCAAR